MQVTFSRIGGAEIGGGQVLYRPIAPLFDPAALLGQILPLIVTIIMLVMIMRVMGKIIPGVE